MKIIKFKKAKNKFNKKNYFKILKSKLIFISVLKPDSLIFQLNQFHSKVSFIKTTLLKRILKPMSTLT